MLNLYLVSKQNDGVVKHVTVIFERSTSQPVKLYKGAIPELPFLVFLESLHMTKFHLRPIWWLNVRKSWSVYVNSPPFLLQLDLFRELRQSDVCVLHVSQISH